MTRHTHKEIRKPARSVKGKSVRTITDAARALGVTREHLSRVRHGHRQSRSLSHRYAQLTGQTLRKAA